MTGTRRDIEPDENGYCPLMNAGEYGKVDGVWHAVPPETDLLANLGAHSVVEHEDGTITVTPSILVTGHADSWHGFLTNGQWSAC